MPRKEPQQKSRHDSRHDSRHAPRQEFRQESQREPQPESRPDSRPDSRPESRQKFRQACRAGLRAKRRGVGAVSARQASERVADYLSRSALWDAEHIALYLANDGELDPSIIAAAARAAGKHLYLPVITTQAMMFCEWLAGDPLRQNRFGIGEPRGEPVAAGVLQLVIIPTVGWTAEGFRLGMGGGYYDRYFAATPAGGATRLGLAYDCQRIDALEPVKEEWDQPLDAVLTESGLQRFY